MSPNESQPSSDDNTNKAIARAVGQSALIGSGMGVTKTTIDAKPHIETPHMAEGGFALGFALMAAGGIKLVKDTFWPKRRR